MLKSLSPETETIASIILYSFCSGSLVLVNKVTLSYFPYPSLVVTVQLWAAIFIIYSLNCLGLITIDPIKWVFVKPYLYYTVAFSLGVFCNMKSLSLSNVETVIVARALSPLVVAFLDVTFLGRAWPSHRSWGALGLIAFGAYGYAVTDDQFRTQGFEAYVWPFFYLFIISFEMAYGKKVVRDVPLKTLSGPVQYTNLLGWPPMLMLASLGKNNEYQKLAAGWADVGVMTILSQPRGLALLGLGCLIGTGIGYTGWWCRGRVSATSYTVIGLVNKCLTVLVNCLIWDQHAGPVGIASLLLCLVGGSLYQQAPLRDGGSEDKKVPQDEASSALSPLETKCSEDADAV